MSKQPSIRAIKTATILAESEGKLSVRQAMVKAGYSPVSANNPQVLTRSKGWKDLMEDVLPDKFLVRKHKALLNKKESIVTYENGKRVVTRTKDVDSFAVSKGLELAYKIKGKFSDSNQINIGEVKVSVNDP